jgi:tRNA(Arg) A34 adenosine deaminase TadA
MFIFEHMFHEALHNEGFGKARMSAVVKVGDTKVMGYNSKKSHPFQKRFAKDDSCIYLHAEIDAIKNYLKFTRDIDSLRDAELYIMRVKRDGRNGPWITGLSKPCVGCLRAIATFGIPHVYYTENNAKEFTCL